MEMWTSGKDGTWKRWSHAGLGLDAVASASPPVVRVLVIGNGPEQDAELLAIVRLTRRLAGGPVTVLAATGHPSARWRESVCQAGADRALLVPGPTERAWQKKDPLDGAIEIGGTVCPELHARHEEQHALSVCGRHENRMVLAAHHFVRWCLAAKEECPHWRGGLGG